MKIYFQLAPNTEARAYLRQLTDAIDRHYDLELVDSDRWHLTIIHIGQLRPIWRQLSNMGNTVNYQQFMAAMEQWVTTLRQLTTSNNYFTLETDSLARYGSVGQVLALRLSADKDLEQLHRRAYRRLVELWKELDINQPAMSMRSLPELKFAHKLNPHVTLARGFDATQPLIELPRQQTLQFSLMKFYHSHDND